MVAFAYTSDLPELSNLGGSFYKESGLDGSFVGQAWIKKWSALMDCGVGFILKQVRMGRIVGSFGFIATEDINNGSLVANETFWFVLPEFRARGFELLIKYEEVAKEMGCARCSMIHLEALQPERLAQLYTKRGYRKVETQYFKNLI